MPHLGRERDALFTFLARPEVQATNWRAEHAIRPAVVGRKQWGGNATWAGAGTWQVLASVLATAAQQRRDPVAILVGLLRTPARSWPTLPSPAPARPVSPTRRTLRPQVRYRVTVAELIDGAATVIMDATGAGFHAAVGDLDDGRLRAEHIIGGPPHLLEHLAELIADHPTGRHRRTR